MEAGLGLAFSSRRAALPVLAPRLRSLALDGRADLTPKNDGDRRAERYLGSRTRSGAGDGAIYV